MSSGPTGPVHFIYLGGAWVSQFVRAIKTARRHDAPIILWSAVPGELPKMPDVKIMRISLPDWLRDHPIQLANVKDLYVWKILYEFGGIYLDLDTITLRPAWDLLRGDLGRDLCVSREFPEGQEAGEPYNSAVVLARRGMPTLDVLGQRALAVLKAGESRWGKTGPHLLTEVVRDYPERFSIAPYRALNGWSYHDIGDYYANPRDPGEDVRVIHLYSSDHLEEFHADRWVP